GPWGPAAILSRIRVEMTQRERLPAKAGHSTGIGDDPAEHPGPTLGGLVEKEDAASVPAREWLRCQLGVFELVDELDRPLEGGPKGRHCPLIERLRGLEQEGV